MRRQRETRGSGPRPFQADLLKAIFNELTDPRTAVDVRNDLEKEVRLLESGLDLRRVGFAMLLSPGAGCSPQRTVIQSADEGVDLGLQRRLTELFRKAPELPAASD